MLFIRSFGQLASTLLKSDLPQRQLVKPHGFTFYQHIRRGSTKDTEKSLLTIHDSCLQRLKTIIDKPDQEYLRINIETGGCSGFSYVFDIENAQQIEQNEDLIFERDNYRVVVNKDMLQFLKGSTIEFHESLIKSSFQVSNPVAETKCSCGSSFSVNLGDLQKRKEER